MMAAPGTVEALREVLAESAPRPLRVVGAGTKRRGSHPVEAPGQDGIDTLDLRGLTGIVSYDPAECVVTVRAGTPVGEVVDALAAHGQYLPWDPPLVHVGATIGGMVASGLSGSGRYRYGGVRDFVIGATVVDGRGRLIASGGQVVKNAAGFLLHHAMVGSAGRLGVVTEVSLKVFPRPQASATIVARASSVAAAIAAHERVRLAVHDLDALDLIVTDTATVLARLAGASAPLAVRAERTRQAFAIADAVVVIGDDERRVWADADAATWTGPQVLKVPTTPTRLARDVAALTALGHCRVSAGGAVAYVAHAARGADIDAHVRAAGLTGIVAAGDAAGSPVGARRDDRAFADRVLAVLDPDRRFR